MTKEKSALILKYGRTALGIAGLILTPALSYLLFEDVTGNLPEIPFFYGAAEYMLDRRIVSGCVSCQWAFQNLHPSDFFIIAGPFHRGSLCDGVSQQADYVVGRLGDFHRCQCDKKLSF